MGGVVLFYDFERNLRVSKRHNVERHFTACHKRYHAWAEGSLEKQQSVFTRPMKKSQKATEASFKATHFRIKKKKAFSDRKVVKEVMMIIANSVLKDEKNGTDIISTLSDVQLGASTMDRRVSTMSGNLADQLDWNLTGLLLWSADIQVSSLTVKLTQTKCMHYHCVIQQQALCAKVIGFGPGMTPIEKIINNIRSEAKQRRIFKVLLEEMSAEYGDLLLHREIRWLSRGRVSHRFLSLLGEI